MRIPLTYRLILYVLAAMTAAVGAIVAYDHSTLHALLLDVGTRDAEIFTSAVYEGLTESMTQGGGRVEHDAIIKAFKATEGVKELKVARLSRMRGDSPEVEGIAALERGKAEAKGELHRESDGSLDFHYTAWMQANEYCTGCHMVQAGDAVGVITLRLSLDRYETILGYHSTVLVLWYGGIIAIATVVLFLGVRKRVLKPLGSLKRSVATLASGDLGHRVRLRTGDEFEELGYSLSEMAASFHSMFTSLSSLSERHMTLIEMAPDAIFLVDMSRGEGVGRVSEVNPAALALTGYPRDELIGSSIEELFSEKKRAEHENAKKSWADHGVGYLHDVTVMRKNGSCVDVDIAASTVEIGGAVYTQEIWRDLSDRKNYERARREYVTVLEETVRERTAHLTRSITELRESEQMLIESAKLASLGEMCAGIAHELNSPMAGIMSITEVLRSRLTADERTSELLDTLMDAVVRSRRILLDMLAYSRGTQSELVPISVNDAVCGTITIFRSVARVQSTEIIENLGQGLPRVRGDKGRLMEVVLNLLKNAGDAAGGGGRVQITTRSLNNDRGSFVVIEVADSGPGIDDAARDRIFEPFFTTKEKGGGLNIGLGLSISSTIIKEHGGSIEAENALDGSWGAVFRVTLPALSEGLVKYSEVT
jgi:PAS domain S-box-containing protein